MKEENRVMEKENSFWSVGYQASVYTELNLTWKLGITIRWNFYIITGEGRKE